MGKETENSIDFGFSMMWCKEIDTKGDSSVWTDWSILYITDNSLAFEMWAAIAPKVYCFCAFKQLIPQQAVNAVKGELAGISGVFREERNCCFP